MPALSGRPAPLGIPADLWDVLACPCPEHAPVRADEGRGVIVCTSCERTFDVRDGIPVMLLEESSVED